jgi:hypothetical protein
MYSQYGVNIIKIYDLVTEIPNKWGVLILVLLSAQCLGQCSHQGH